MAMALPSILMPAISTDEEEKRRRVGLLVVKLRFRERGGVDEDE